VIFRNLPPTGIRHQHPGNHSNTQAPKSSVIFHVEVYMWYDVAIMMAKTQITLETEMQRRARQRANDLGVSLAEYFRRLVARDLARPETAAPVDRIFDLGSSGGSDIASQKDSMIAEAFHSTRRKLRRR
jgi:hypothetical protein